MSYQNWEHQTRANAEVDQAKAQGYKRICITSPTGGGKSKMMRDRIISAGLPTTVYTHRTMLRDQLAAGMREDGIPYGMRASGFPMSPFERVQIAMVRTEGLAVVTHGNRERHESREQFIDEAHNNANGQVVELLEGHKGTRIGYTATPLGIGHMYDKLIVAGTNSELRACGAHVKALHFGPSEVSSNVIGKVKIGEGECGITKQKRKIFAQKIYGSVVENYRKLNPEQKPAILFAPGVPESIWFCEQLNEMGIPAAHICGKYVHKDGVLIQTTKPEIRQEVIERVRDGEIKILCNRFVLREGIDIREVYHCIFATIFGSLTAYLQAGGRVVRSHPSMDHVIIQDHGGNGWRHGSLNENREWDLSYTDRIVSGMRMDQLRENPEEQPIYCEKCGGMRLGGMKCHHCGHEVPVQQRRRKVIQADGTLKPMAIEAFKPRRYLESTLKLKDEWANRIRSIRRSKKDSVKKMSFAQARSSFAESHGWKFPPNEWPMMPIHKADWFKRVSEIPLERLTK